MKKEKKKELIVLDNGIEKESLIGPMGVCCAFVFMPYRGG
jgi:hypothetical protein